MTEDLPQYIQEPAFDDRSNMTVARLTYDGHQFRVGLGMAWSSPTNPRARRCEVFEEDEGGESTYVGSVEDLLGTDEECWREIRQWIAEKRYEE